MLKPIKVAIVGFFCLLDWGLLLLLALLLLFVCFLNMPLSLSALRVSSFSVDYELHFYSLFVTTLARAHAKQVLSDLGCMEQTAQLRIFPEQ